MDFSKFTPQPRMAQSGPFTIQSPHAKPIAGETIPRRHPLARDGFKAIPEDGCETLYDVLIRSARKFGGEKGFGTRKLLKKHVETQKVRRVIDGHEQFTDKDWTYLQLTGYVWTTFSDYVEQSLQIGSGLRKLGLVKGDIVHLYAATSMHWLSMAHGAVTQSMPIATAYDTLGEEGLTHSLDATKAKLMFLDAPLLRTLIEPLKQSKHLQILVYNEDSDLVQADVDLLLKVHPHLTVLSYEELRECGEDNSCGPVPPSSEDTCCIMYTSGSTGPPKGVVIKHKAIVGSIAGGGAVIHEMLTQDDVYMAYLPLAHIIEFTLENCCLFWGAAMGYGSPRTLTDSSVRKCKGDLRELQPTILAGVPAVWENVRKGVTNKVDASNFFVNGLFWGALTLKGYLLDNNLPGPSMIDNLLFSRVRDATGGKLRLCLTGGGPIAKETQYFISMVIAMLINGYGLTETTSMTALCDPLQWTTDAIGGMPPTVEVKLVDYAEAGYFAKNNQGEVWVRGPTVSLEYHDNKKETEAAMTSDGWFRTGDVGEWDSNYHLRIIDRTKNLVKTLNGEYIAIEKLESTYRSTAIVANICVYASPAHAKPIAIIVPAEAALVALGKTHGMQEDFAGLCRSSQMQPIVLAELQRKGREGGLKSLEIVEGVVLSEEEWTPQNNLVTPAQKLLRKNIVERFDEQIKRAYASV